MSDLQSLSDEELKAALAAAQGQQGASAVSPDQTRKIADNGGMASDPSTGGGSLQVGLPLLGTLDTGIPTSQGVDRFLSGMGRGFVHTGRSIGNLLGVVPDSVLKDEKITDAPLLNTGAGKWGNIAGEAAITTPIGMGAMGAVGQMGKIGAGIAGGAILNPAAQGGLQGLVTADPGERTKNATLGAVTGGLLGAAGAGMGKLVHGLKRTPEAETLLKEGISLTPGQLNPEGAANQFEQALESVPGAKQIIHGARDNAEQQFQAAVIQKGAAPGTTIKPSGNINKMLQDAYDSYAPLYDQAKGFPVKPVIMSTGQDVPLETAFKQASNAPGAPSSIRKSANEWLKDQLTKFKGTSDSLIDLRSNLRARARQMNLSTDINAKDAAGIYERAADAVTKSLRSQLPNDALSALDSADSNYGNYKIVESAVAKAKDNIAGLTPHKLSQAIYDSIGNPAYARGAGGSLRDLAQAGTSVFQTVSPPTGARVATLGAGALAALKAPLIAVPTATGMLGMAGTNVGRRFAAGMTAPQVAIQSLEGAAQKNLPPAAINAAKALLARQGVGAAMPAVQQLGPPALAAALLYGLGPKPSMPTTNQ